MTANEEHKSDQLSFSLQPSGRGQKKGVLVVSDGKTTYPHRLDIMDSSSRKKAVDEICIRWPVFDNDEGKQKILKEIEETAAHKIEADEEDLPKKSSQADLLVELVRDAELFHTPGSYDSEGHITVDLGDHRETWPVKSKAVRRWISERFFSQYEKVPSSQALQDALNVVSGQAIHKGDEREVHIRIARHKDAIWIDLADANWKAVEINLTGWRVVESNHVPIRFIRKRGMLPLPLPVRGGTVNELRPLVNIPDDDDWMLFIGWLLMAFYPCGPFPVLAVNGEQGSSKTSLCRIGRALVDPNIAPLRRPPKSDRDLIIAASNSWIYALDNLSGLQKWLSDTLCSLATGGAFGARELFSDDDEKLFDAKRPIMLNGIDDIATRGDLASRAITLTLPVIPKTNRIKESVLKLKFEEVRPRVLGALLDAVSEALTAVDTISIKDPPRMADFAYWVTSAEPALGWEPGAFLSAYSGNRDIANTQAVEAFSIGPVIRKLVDRDKRWEGTAGELLKVLEAYADEPIRKRPDWPKTPRKVSGDLRRISPCLREEGIEVTFPGKGAGGNSRRLLRLEKIPVEPSRPTPDRLGTVPREEHSNADQRRSETVGTVETVETVETGSFLPKEVSRDPSREEVKL